jgi:hypothetical protein
MASDYSYAAEDIGKMNYRIAGDSAAFIDPFFSSGVHLAFVGGLSAALSIISVIDGTADESTAAEFHNAEVKTAYTRFFVVVAAGYKQMRGGVSGNVLNDIDEKNFDRAFGLIRPVIQGTGDIGVNTKATSNQELSEEEIRASMDFIFRLFSHPPKGAVANRDRPDDGLQGNIADLNKDARARLAALSKCLPNFMGFDGVKHILDGAREQMRLAVIGETAVELRPVAAM